MNVEYRLHADKGGVGGMAAAVKETRSSHRICSRLLTSRQVNAEQNQADRQVRRRLFLVRWLVWKCTTTPL